MPHHPTDLCQALRNWRIRSRLQQASVARNLGVTQGQISRWESGRDTPRPHNVEAIRQLIWGADAEPLRALRHFVEHSEQHLLLIDARHEIIARSRPLARPTNPLQRFGWVLDPLANPAFAPAYRRFIDRLDNPTGTIGMVVTLPFAQDGDRWVATISKTIYSVAGLRVCLAEPRFAPAASDAPTDIQIVETRLDHDDTERFALALWHQTPLAGR